MASSKIDFIDCGMFGTATSSSNAAPTTIKFIVGSNGSTYYGGFGNWAVATTSYDATAKEISTAVAGNNFYMVDGTRTLLISGTAAAYSTINTGSTGQPPSKSRNVAVYRNRLVFTRTVDDPQNYFMSAVGAYTTFNYDDQTLSGAIAGNVATSAGKLGGVINAFIPHADDWAIFGLSDSVHVLHGDPRAGGNIDLLIKGGGIVGPQAWAFDHEGRLFYLSQRDLMTIPSGGGQPTSISQGRIQKFLSGIDYSTYRARLAWDIEHKGLWCFFTKSTAATVYHLWWDARMDAFSIMQFPAQHGPTAVKSIAGESFSQAPSNNSYQKVQLIMGSFDGYLWNLGDTYLTDRGTAIDSYVQLTPQPIAGMGERGIINEVEFVMGTVPNPKASISCFVGDNAQDAINRTDSSFETVTTETGRVNFRSRARGQTAVFEVANSTLGKRWALESSTILAFPAGRGRGD